jgi:hypothetical protein
MHGYTHFDELKPEGSYYLEYKTCSYDCRQGFRHDGTSYKYQCEWDNKRY